MSNKKYADRLNLNKFQGENGLNKKNKLKVNKKKIKTSG